MQTIPSFKTNFEPIITNYETTITNSDTLKQLEDNKTTTK